MSDDLLRRVPPHDDLAEEAIVASILERPALLPEVLQSCDSQDFYRQSLRAIFDSFVRNSSEGIPIDAVTTIDSVRRAGDLGTKVEASYITDLLARTIDIPPSHAPAHARLIRELALKRDLSSVAADLASAALDGGESGALISDAQSALDKLRERQIRKRKSTADVLHETIAHLDDVMAEARSTGFHNLDRETRGGFQPGEVWVVAAQTARAKTTLALNVAASVAKAGGGALFLSLEMTERELSRRLLFSDAQVDHIALVGGDLSSSERERLLRSAHEFASKHLAIEYHPKLTPATVRAVAQRFKREWGRLDLIVADYVQLMSPDTRQQNREREVASITRDLKCIAGELGCSVMAVAQLNREVTKREDGRPRLSDLRDSGAIEQDADLVLFICGSESGEGGPVQIVIAKNRRGPCSHATLLWRPNMTRFEDAT